MNCIEFEKALEFAVEAREPLDPATLAHANTCAECRKIWETHQNLEAAIVAWKFAEPPSGFVDSVMAQLASPGLADDFGDESINERRDSELKPLTVGDFDHVNRFGRSNAFKQQRSSGLAIASVAACLAIAVAFTLQTPHHAPNGGMPVVGTQKSFQDPIMTQANADTPLDLSGTLTAVLSDLKSEYREMASETSSVAREVVNAIPHPAVASMLPETDEIQLRPSSSDMARIWQPIGSRVGSALGFLWQAVPSDVPSG